MFYLFSYFFFFLFLFSFLLGVYFMQGFSYSMEFVVPYCDLSGMSFIFVFDFISLFFFSSVCLISFVIFLYSKFYMGYFFSFSSNLTLSRFFYLLFLFVLSMGFVIFSGSWVTVMLGWDGLGLVSFLLVIFYNNTSSLDSGVVTFFTNRMGDSLFIISFVFFFFSGWVSFDSLGFLGGCIFSFILFLGCVTKSAQFPFSSWLPAAMAAPTPVSSLVHSSTLVTAGVYLLIRFNFLISSVNSLVLFLSLVTMFLGGLCASYELDFKKVVAMSTLSQLGFMIFSISCGLWFYSFFHMVFHAFFKSILFISTGSLMHDVSGAQDSRYFGSMGSSFFSKVMFSLSSLSLMGFPFSLGFYTKDSILGALLYGDLCFISLVFFICCCLTVSYSFRMVWMGFFLFSSFGSLYTSHSDYYFFVPLLFLYLYCVFMGNFFFFSFFPVCSFSFMDFFLGLLIILTGLFFMIFLPNLYLLVYSFSSMLFLSTLGYSYMSSKFLFLNSQKLDSTWGELLGGKGLLVEAKSVNNYLRSFFNLSFSSIVLVLIFLFFFL